MFVALTFLWFCVLKCFDTFLKWIMEAASFEVPQ